jgi:hypothetical protein
MYKTFLSWQIILTGIEISPILPSISPLPVQAGELLPGLKI